MSAPTGGAASPASGPLGPEADVVVALDLFGGDHGAEVIASAVAALTPADRVAPILVGPPDVAASLIERHALPASVAVIPASSHVAMDDDAVAAVRTRPDTSVRVCAELVRDRRAHATVSIGHTGAALAAATFTLGRLPGVTRAAVAVVVPGLRGNVVLLDAGGTPDAGPDLLLQFARSGVAFAEALGLHDSPRVGLLTIGTEPGKGDAVRRRAHDLLAASSLRYIGPVEGQDIALGGTADVVVTDGFTGNVALKALEGATEAAAARIADEYEDPVPALRVARGLLAGAHTGAVLLGVDGVSVVGHGGSAPDEVLACIRLAARVVREGLVQRTAAALTAPAAPPATPAAVPEAL